MTRHTRRLAAMIAIAAIAFAQFAMAAHACAAIAEADAPPPAHAVAAHAMPAGHGQMPCDQAAASDTQNLCVQHCQSNTQSVDQHPNPLLVPLLVPVCDLASADALAITSSSTQYYSHALLARVTAPPLAVQHCRFLI